MKKKMKLKLKMLVNKFLIWNNEFVLRIVKDYNNNSAQAHIGCFEVLGGKTLVSLTVGQLRP